MWHMARAGDAEKAERINHGRRLLQRFDHLPEAVDQMVRECSISHRQAYRYLRQARRLKQDVPITDAKVAFTVKLSERLVDHVRSYAKQRGLSLSDMVSRALEAFLPRRAKRG
jgi:hypothetical protein